MAIEFAPEWAEQQRALVANESSAIPADSQLTVLVSEINMLTRQTTQNILAIGQRLTQIKVIVGHGNFEGYIKERCGYSWRVANRFMKIAAEYTADTLPQGIGIGKLDELLSLPPAEREEFVATHDVENATVRELRAEIARVKVEKDSALIRERVEAAEREKALRENVRSTSEFAAAASNAKKSAEEQLKHRQEEITRLRRALDAAEKEKQALADELVASPNANAAVALAEAEAERRAEKRFSLELEAARAALAQAEAERDELLEAAEPSGGLSVVTLSSVTVQIQQLHQTLNALRDLIVEDAWNVSGQQEDEWLALCQVELSKVAGVLDAAQGIIIGNAPEGGNEDV